jgi:hypothetical protein
VNFSPRQTFLSASQLPGLWRGKLVEWFGRASHGAVHGLGIGGTYISPFFPDLMNFFSHSFLLFRSLLKMARSLHLHQKC